MLSSFALFLLIDFADSYRAFLSVLSVCTRSLGRLCDSRSSAEKHVNQKIMQLFLFLPLAQLCYFAAECEKNKISDWKWCCDAATRIIFVTESLIRSVVHFKNQVLIFKNTLEESHGKGAVTECIILLNLERVDVLFAG